MSARLQQAWLALVVSAVVGGATACDKEIDPCANETGVCIRATVESMVKGIDQLKVTVDRPAVQSGVTPATADKNLKLPRSFAITLPAGTTGAVAVRIDGLIASAIRATDVDTITVGAKPVDVRFVLVGSGDVDGGGTDAAPLPDLAGADLTGADLTNEPDLTSAGCAGITACVSNDTCCPAGCDSSSDNDCAPAVCGDGTQQPGEACDDNNLDNGDGCDPTCRFTNTLTIISGRDNGPGYSNQPLGPDVRFQGLSGAATDGTNLWFSDRQSRTIRKIDPTTGATTVELGSPGIAALTNGTKAVARLQGPSTMAVVTSEYGRGLFFTDGPDTDDTQQTLRCILLDDPNRTTSTYLSASGPYRAVFGGDDGNGKIRPYVLSTNGLYPWRFAGSTPTACGGSGSNGPTVSSATINMVAGVNAADCFSAIDGGGTGTGHVVYIGCPGVILKNVGGSSGTTSIFAGQKGVTGCSDNATATSATITSPIAMVRDGNTVRFTDRGCDKIRAAGSSGVTTVVGTGTGGLADVVAGDLRTAQLSAPQYMTGIGANLFVTETFRIRKITLDGEPNGTTALLAGATPLEPQVAYDASGVTTSYTLLDGLWSSGTQLYGMTAYLQTIQTISYANGGNALFFSLPDATNFATSIYGLGSTIYTSFSKGQIRKMALDGSGDAPFTGVANTTPPVRSFADDGTSLYVLDGARMISRIDTDGVIYPIAGTANSTDVVNGTGAAAHFQSPRGLAYANGALYTSDNDGAILRKIDVTTGEVTTYAGAIDTYAHVDNDVPTMARFGGVSGLASNGESLFVLDAGRSLQGGNAPVGNTIRQVELATGRVTTMIGVPAQGVVKAGVGNAALVNTPTHITYDNTTKALHVFDTGAVFRVK